MTNTDARGGSVIINFRMRLSDYTTSKVRLIENYIPQSG